MSWGRILPVLFTLLLAVQGEPVLGARTKMIVRPAGDGVPAEAYGLCVPVRMSRDGVPVCSYDTQLPDGQWVGGLTAEALAAYGVNPLSDVLHPFAGRGLRLFLELCPPVGEMLSSERHAERELILRRAEDASCALFLPAADSLCGCVPMAEEALRTAYEAGFRPGEVWLITGDATLCARFGGKSSKVPVCYISPDGMGAPGMRGSFLHRTQVTSKSDVKRLRRGGRRVVVWDVNSTEDAEALRSYGVDFLLTDDPALIDSLK